MPVNKKAFYDTVTLAVNDLAANGFDSVERIASWERRLREAALQSLAPAYQIDKMLRDAMVAIYTRMVEKGRIVKYHKGIGPFKLDKVRPQLRAELDKRIMASAKLITLNREQAITKTLQRFSGWSTTIPKGGMPAVSKRAAKADIRKSLTALPFEERRVLIDQGQKFVAALNDTLAKDGGALALTWRSNWRQEGYNYREDHKERDGCVYTLRPNWALDKGLMKAGEDGYYDSVTPVATEINCRCYAEFIYNLSGLPPEMLTRKGDAALSDARDKAGELLS